MGGPGSGRRRKPPKAAPKGARWLEARAEMFRRYGDTCWICGHPGATEADHVVPGALLDAASYHDVANLQPAHGHRAPCLVCGKACNQVRGGPSRILAASRNGNGASGRSMHLTSSGNGAQNPPGPAGTKRSEAELRAAVASVAHQPGCKCLAHALTWGAARSRCW